MVATVDSPQDKKRAFGKVLRLVEQAEQSYYTFKPRPDQPERLDQQQSFVESSTEGISWLVGGNGAGTSECAMHKVAKFVLRNQPPPREDTPFWIIAGTYEQCMESLWKEKLYGHGHIPKGEIDWDRISWYKPNQNWPFRVPLKPWPGRPNKNWVLEFKSYEQGRSQMQARAIGGFCFSEQFPWGILQEVLRGCREYNFPGSKFCEFTPIDPNLSIELEALDEDDALPPGWEIYRANTECAMEAGHVSKSWFDEFFAMVPEEMRMTRMTGAWATYEGQVYQGFNPAIHLVGDDVINFPSDVYYRRSIDWGAGPSNAFSAHWWYRNSKDQWFCFDEYYSTDQGMTTVDHLCEIQDRWPWPVNNPYYGTTWCDPADPDNCRIAQKLTQYCPRNEDGTPKYRDMDISRASNAVLEGIEHVQYMLKPKTWLGGQPQLFIHKRNCPNLARQMRTYRWERSSEAGLNPRDAAKRPLKSDDHAVDDMRYLLFSEARSVGGTIDSARIRPDRKARGIQLAKGA